MGDSGPQGIAVRIVDIHGVDLGGAVLGTVTLDAASLAALESITAVISPSAAAVTHSADLTVDGTAGGVTALAANANRRACFIQNVGPANIRVSIGGTPTATTGTQLVPGAMLIVEGDPEYGCPTGAIKAIRESSTSSTVAVAEFV